MKRVQKRKPEPPEWEPFKTLFKWHICEECGMEFRREIGYRKSVFNFSIFNMGYDLFYRCAECHAKHVRNPGRRL